MHGWLILDKPLGVTSAHALNQAKRILKVKKAGHAGTLDPLASGILPLAFGEATKTIPFITDASKTYQFTVTFGAATSTDDVEGEVTETSEVMPTKAQIEAILAKFTGTISQMPPVYSALKIDGKRAYDLARAGIEVVLKSREIIIHSLRIISMLPLYGGAGICKGEARSGFRGGDNADAPPPISADAEIDSPARGECLKSVSFEADCSKGTYIRALGRDIALELGTVGHITQLRRTRVGRFSESQAISLETLKEIVHSGALFEKKWLLPVGKALDDILVLSLSRPQALKFRQGQKLIIEMADTKNVSVMCGEVLVGLGRVENGTLLPVRMFNLE